MCTADYAAFLHNLRMKYIDSNKLSESQFKCYIGISCSTFDLMVEQLKKHVSTKGKPPKLGLEDHIFSVCAIDEIPNAISRCYKL